MSDVNMGGTITPGKIDKASRYSKPALSFRKHAPGKGQISNSRGFSPDPKRKRKRHNYDKDVGTAPRRGRDDWDDSETTSDDGLTSRPKHSSRKKEKSNKDKGGWAWWLSEYPDTPEYVYRWVQLVINLFVATFFLYMCFTVVRSIRDDLTTANEAARQKLMSEMTACQNEYTINECAKKDRPALTAMCDKWYDCMIQSPESIMRVRITVVQLGELLNDFVDTVQWKAWVSGGA